MKDLAFVLMLSACILSGPLPEALASEDALEGLSPRQWAQRLSDPDPRIRRKAIRRILRSGANTIPLLLHRDLYGSEAWEALPRLFRAMGSDAVPALQQALESGDKDIRRRALRALSWLGPAAKDAAPSLLSIAGHDTLVVRALVGIGREAVSPVLAALHDGSFRRGSLLYILERIGQDAEEALPDMILLLRSEEWGERGRAVDIVRAIGRRSPAASEVLRDLLSDAMPYVRGNAALALAHAGEKSREDLEILISLIAKEECGHRCMWARHDPCHAFRPMASAIAAFGPPARDAETVLERKLGSECPWARVAAARALLSIGAVREDVIQLLAGELRTPRPHQLAARISRRTSREEAARALLQAGSAAASCVEIIIEVLEDPSSWALHESCLRLLEEIGPPAKAAAPHLMERLRRRELHADASVAYWRITGDAQATVGFLSRVMVEASDERRWRAIRDVREILPDSDAVISLLEAALGSRDEAVKREALLALTEYEARAVAAARTLFEEFGSPFPEERRLALAAALRMGPSAIPFLLEKCGDDDPEVRGLAQEALSRLQVEK